MRKNRTARLSNRRFTAAEALLHFNNGLGHYHSRNPATGEDGTLRDVPGGTMRLAASWDLTELSGTRADSSGNGRHLSETGGSVVSSKLVMEARDAGPRGYRMYPVRQGAAGSALSKPHFCAAMRYVTGAVGSAPAFRSYAGIAQSFLPGVAALRHRDGRFFPDRPIRTNRQSRILHIHVGR